MFNPAATANAGGYLKAKLLATLKDRNFWWGLLFLLALLSMFVIQLGKSLPDYKSGEIADSTVRANRDIQVPDPALTEKKRMEAQGRVLPLYDYDPNLANSSVSRMHEILAFLRARMESTPASSVKDFEKLAKETKAQLNVNVDSSFLSLGAKRGFGEELERFLAQKLRKAMSQDVVSDRNLLILYASRGLTIRNQENGREETIGIGQIPDVHMLRESLRSELIADDTLTNTEANAYADFVNGFLGPTISMNSYETQARLLSAGKNIEPVFYQIKKGKVIVRDGEEVTPAIETQLRVLRQFSETKPPIRYSIGLALLLSIFFIAFNKYLSAHQFSNIKLRNKQLFRLCGVVLVGHVLIVRLGLLVATSLSAAYASAPFNVLLAYQVAVPFAAGALLLTVLADREISTIYSFGFAVLVGILTHGDFFLALYCLASGIAAAFSIYRYYQRSALLRSFIWIFLSNLTAVFTIYLLQEMALDWNNMLFHAACAAVSALLSAAIASVFSPLLEWWFDITTDIKLLELSNLDLPVLRQLALEAPGTYHHSIVMGTIAEAAAVKVGANPLFLRVAALYHDIGKIRKSEYYVENQREINKHDSLNPRMSALVIINHVKEGLEVAKMLRLPTDIADMIPQHHGTRLITYFYKKAKDMENPELEVVKEEDYRYPGPKPQTKEGAILMLADATEAASRTLTEPSPARLRNMVDTLFRAIFEDGQMDESNLTMRDLHLIADAFVRKLESVFHHRISYPGYEFNKDERAKDSGESKEFPEKMAN